MIELNLQIGQTIPTLVWGMLGGARMGSQLKLAGSPIASGEVDEVTP